MYKTEAIGKASKDAPLEKIMVGREGMTFLKSILFLRMSNCCLFTNKSMASPQKIFVRYIRIFKKKQAIFTKSKYLLTQVKKVDV